LAVSGKTIAWAAIAGGEDRPAGKYRMSLGGSTKSASLAKSKTEEHFAKTWPGVKMTVSKAVPIRKGE
jgi:hypothetical protein